MAEMLRRPSFLSAFGISRVQCAPSASNVIQVAGVCSLIRQPCQPPAVRDQCKHVIRTHTRPFQMSPEVLNQVVRRFLLTELAGIKSNESAPTPIEEAGRPRA